jgi:hypothetical protein
MPGTQNVWSPSVTLTNLSVMPPEGKYLSDIVAPTLEIAVRTAKIIRIDPNYDMDREEYLARAPGTPAKRFDVDLTRPVTVTPTDHALDGVIPDEDAASASEAVADAMDITTINREKLYVAKEVELVALLAATFTGGSTSSPTNKWGTDAGTFFTDVDAKIDTIKIASGVKPNALACDESVIRKIGHSANFREYVKRTLGVRQIYGRGETGLRNTADLIAEVLGLQYVDFADLAMVNNTIKGQTKSLGNIWGENVLLYHRETPRKKTMNTLLTAAWNGTSNTVMGGVRMGWRVKQWYDADAEAMKYRVGRWWHQVALTSDTGHLFTNVLTAP